MIRTFKQFLEEGRTVVSIDIAKGRQPKFDKHTKVSFKPISGNVTQFLKRKHLNNLVPLYKDAAAGANKIDVQQIFADDKLAGILIIATFDKFENILAYNLAGQRVKAERVDVK